MVVLNMSWWHHQVETFFVLLALYEENPPVTGSGGFPSHRAMMQSFDVFFDLPLNKQTIKTPVIWDIIVLIMMSL